MQDEENKKSFSEDFWRETGGQQWADYIDNTEASLKVFNEPLLESADIKPGFTVLDIGCGGGITTMEVAKLAGESGKVIGVDISAPILSVTKNRTATIDNLDVIEADAATMDLSPASFDRIISRFGVMFFTDPVQAFKNFNQALKPEGKVVFICWRPMDLNNWMHTPINAVMSVIPPAGPPPEPTAPGPFSMQDKSHTESILNKAGFDVTTFEAIDMKMDIGPIAPAVDYFMCMGPCAALMAEITDQQKADAKAAMEQAMSNYEVDGRYIAPAAVWLVTASNSSQ